MEFPTTYGPLSLSGLRWYLGALHKAWASQPVQLTTSVVGTAYLLYGISRTASFFWDFWRPSKLQIYCHSETGSWALVTGSSDGIGFGFADELLDRGFNVLLHGRNAEKLQRKRDELAKKYPKRSVDTVVADASKPDDSFLRVAEKAQNLPGNGKLTVLINNVGGVPLKPLSNAHWEIPHDHIDLILNLNVRFTTQLTRALLPVLKANGPGLIINCGSIAGVFGIPYIATYSGTKGYIHSFTKAVKNDCLSEGVKDIEVMGLLIGSVQSSGNTEPTGGLTISSRACAAGGLDRVGSGKALAVAHWRHAMPLALLSMLPESIAQNSLATEMRRRKEIERKGE